MKLGIKSGKLKIKSDTPKGLRAVSCGCCKLAECCMYSAQGLYDRFYSVDDLPDSIVVDGQILKKGVYYDSTYAPTPDIHGAFYGNYDENFLEVYVFLFDGIWKTGQGIGRDSAECLINEDWHDQFADSYTISHPNFNFTVLRMSQCLWVGDNLNGGKIFLGYNFGAFPGPGENPFKDRYGWGIFSRNISISSGTGATTGNNLKVFKPFNQNLGPSPAGIYTGNFNITVL